MTGERAVPRVVEDIVTYVLRDLRHAEGGFFSAEDADSEGIEGKFYCWSLDEVREVCGADADEAIAFFGVTERGNFEDPHTGFRGNILHAVDRHAEPSAGGRARPGRAASPAASSGYDPGSTTRCCSHGTRSSSTRSPRPPRSADRDDWMEVARTNARFLLRELRRDDGRFLRSWRARHLAYAEDYAALLEALCTLAEHDDVAWLADARVVADELLRLFHDDDGGGFFTTGHDAEALDRAREGSLRQRDAIGELTRGQRIAAARRAHRRAALRDARACECCNSWRGPWQRTRPRSRTRSGAAERQITAPLEVAIVGERAEPRTHALCKPNSPLGCSRPQSPCRSRRATPRRCSPAGRSSTARRRPTCASTTRAGCPSRRPKRSGSS